MADPQPADAMAGLHVESSGSAAKPEDYVVVGAHRLVSMQAGSSAIWGSAAACAAGGLLTHGIRLVAPRQVKPYHFDFCCNVRQRWLGQNIIDIFTRVRRRCAAGRSPLAAHQRCPPAPGRSPSAACLPRLFCVGTAASTQLIAS